MRIFLFFLYILITNINAQTNNINDICKKLYKAIEDKETLKIAVLNFYNINLQDADSKIITERITSCLLSYEKITLVERTLIEKIYSELRLQQSGMVNEKDASKIGQISGADYIVTGTINSMKDNKIEINARIIEVSSSKIIAGTSGIINKDWQNTITQPIKNTYLRKPLTQIAILLDTSNSMDGLIEQAKRHLWSIVNELVKYEKSGSTPNIEIALYEYGNDSLAPNNGYIRKISDFTSDIDKIAKELFSLKTNGGEEYCGWVIKDAVENLKWDNSDDTYKAIFIAGNEPFTQGPINYEEAILKAKSKGIFVNTIFCGPRQQGIAYKWKDAADINQGDFNNIDQNYISDFKTPYDDKIAQLTEKINQTYIPYGKGAKEKYKEKIKLDEATLRQSPAVLAERTGYAINSAKEVYSSWDLITAIESGDIKIDEIKNDELPEELNKMDKKELIKYIEDKLLERKKIKEEISKNITEREKYIEKQKMTTEKDLGKSIIETVRNQLKKKGFKPKHSTK